MTMFNENPFIRGNTLPTIRYENGCKVCSYVSATAGHTTITFKPDGTKEEKFESGARFLYDKNWKRIEDKP